MSKPNARIPGFYQLSLEERLDRLVDEGWLTAQEARAVSGPGFAGGFDTAIADAHHALAAYLLSPKPSLRNQVSKYFQNFRQAMAAFDKLVSNLSGSK